MFWFLALLNVTSCTASSCVLLKEQCLKHNIFSCVNYQLCGCTQFASTECDIAKVGCYTFHFAPACIAYYKDCLCSVETALQDYHIGGDPVDVSLIVTLSVYAISFLTIILLFGLLIHRLV